MKIYFLRHGLTAGNLEKRYIGRTDEPLCAEGERQLENVHIPRCEVLFCSPMIRCIRTAEIVFPEQSPIIHDDLRECDFGDFEGKNYKELSGDPYYQSWIDSGGTLPFPGGEAPWEFKKRCCDAFERLMKKYSVACNHAVLQTAAFVVHGGTIMSVLEKYALPHKDYYSWHCENGHGFSCDFDGEHIRAIQNS